MKEHQFKINLKHLKRFHCLRRAGSNFTLIERERLDNTSESSPVKSPESMNCSFHIDSLTAGERGDARTGCAVTKSTEREPPAQGGLWPVPKALLGNEEQQIAGRLNVDREGTGNQSGRRGEHAGRRLTNVRRHRKGEPTVTRRPCPRPSAG
jgi:hypothetical protein